MPSINHILIDMDGVLVNFFDDALAVHGFNAADYPPGEWEIAKVLGISKNEFWAKLDAIPRFWSGLQPYPWFRDTISWLDQLKGQYSIDWTIATSPSLNPLCNSEKVEWMRAWIGRGFKDYMIGSKKHLMAKPATLLIDDGEHNVDPFVAAGGRAVLWPALWNRAGKSDDPLGFVIEQVRKFLY